MSEELGYSFRCASLKVAENNPSGTGSQYSTMHRGAVTKKREKEEKKADPSLRGSGQALRSG